jgi:predicted metal-binding membrane protein
MDPAKAELLQQLFPTIAVIVSIVMAAWVLTTWLRIKNGYPLDGAWGQAVYPKKMGDEAMERIKLLSAENAQLRAELGSVKDRLANVERIVTDDSHRLTQEIEALRLPRN